MRISDTAPKNHEELFPNRKSTLAETDPELIEVFDNFAFDEVLGYGNLDTRTRLMVILAAMIASQALGEYKVMLGGALNVGVTPVEVKEIVYQAVPYVGMAKVYDFILATNEILESKGIKLPLEGQSTTSPETRFEKGLALQKAIVGDERIDKMYAGIARQPNPHSKIFIGQLFWRLFNQKRDGYKNKRAFNVFHAAVPGGCEPQLKGHIQTNLNVGNDKETLLSVVTQLLPYVGYPRTLNAIRCLNEAPSE